MIKLFITTAVRRHVYRYSTLLKWPPGLALMPGHRAHSCSGYDHVLNKAFGFVGFRLTDHKLSQRMSRQKVRKLTRNLLQYWTIA